MDNNKEFYIIEIKSYFYRMYSKLENVKLDLEELRDYYDIMDEVILYLNRNMDNDDYILDLYNRISSIYLKYNKEKHVKTK